ncbi:MAG TPA: hypothetical protein DEU67_06400, partial [Acidobacteria bacterium]|nr:hypothetical protein [Acidobacteriota bacterium]
MRSTLLLLTLAAMLAAYAYFIEADRPPRVEAENAKERVFNMESVDLVELEVTASGDRTVLRKTDGIWNIIEPVRTKADGIEVSSITTGVSALEIERVVQDIADDLDRFGLSDPTVEIAFKAEGEDRVTRLLLGNQTSTGGHLYAMRSDDPRVFLVDAYLQSSFDLTTFDFRDKAIVEFDRDDVDRLSLTTSTHTVKLVHADGVWLLEEPWKLRAASNTVNALLTKLDTARMQAVIETDGANLEVYGLAAPLISAVIGAGSAGATLLVGTNTDNGNSYARDEARSLIFTVENSLVDDLTRSPEDYRQVELFTFNPTTTTRLEIEQPEARLVITKSEVAPFAWQRLEPLPGEVDQGTVSDLV